MDLEHLRYFLTILECGSLNKAAEKLYITKPTLRSAIATLEQELTAPLLERTKSGCFPTEFGKQVAEEAHIMFDQIDRWRQIAISNSTQATSIRINATRPFCETILTPLAIKIRTAFPSVNLTISNAKAEDTLISIQKQKCDIGVICAYYEDLEKIKNALPLKDWIVKQICDDQFMAVLNRNNPLSKLEKLSLKDLKSFSRLSLTNAEYFTSSYSDFTAFLPKPTLSIDTHNNAFQIISEDPNYYTVFSILLQNTNSYLRLQNNLCFKTIHDIPLRPCFYLICKQDSFLSPSERLICNLIYEACRNIGMKNSLIL